MLNQLKNHAPARYQVVKAIRNTYGIGFNSGTKICRLLGVCKNQTIELSDEELLEPIVKWVNFTNLTVEQDLRKLKLKTTQKLLDMKVYRAIRKSKGYPARGQRTRSNGKTAAKLQNKL